MAQTTPLVQKNTLSCATGTIPVESAAWWSWLKAGETTSFRFTCSAGNFTARREQKQSGCYWYAYRRQQGKLHKAYLGKSVELTLQRLHTVAEILGQSPSSTAPSASVVHIVPDDSTSATFSPAEPVYPSLSQNLLSTKLTVPPVLSTVVARPRLLQKLNQGIEHKLTLITAPAGFGKTTLLSDWQAAQNGNGQDIDAPTLAWVSLDAGDNDPIRFWSYCIAALETVYPRISEKVLSLLRLPQAASMETMLITLINTISVAQRTCILVLDDYHLLEAQPIHTALTFLLDHLPPQLHLVLACRIAPPLPLARLRVEGQLTVLSTDDLRFTGDETVVFFNQVMALGLSTSHIATLEDKTEGWITGLQLAALSLQELADPAHFISAFTGSHRYIVDYLVEEVLQRQTERLQQFLLQTAVLERFCDTLCTAVTGYTDSATLLTQLERANLFLVPLDDERHWYRYHHLFADVLRNRLQQTQPQAVTTLYHKAAQWYEQRGLIAEAIHYALAAHAYPLAMNLIEKNVEKMFQDGEVITLKSWIDMLPAAVRQANPRICSAHAATYISINQLDRAEECLHDAERALETIRRANVENNDPQHTAYIVLVTAELAVSYVSLHAFRGETALALALSERALALLPEDSIFLRSVVAASLATAYTLHGDVLAAAKALIEAKAASQEANNTHVLLASVSGQAYLLMEQGQLHRAAEVYRQSLSQAAQPHGQVFPVASVAYVGLGEIFYQWNDLEAALHHLEEGVTLGEQWGYILLHTRGYVILARAKYASGDVEGAFQVTRKAEQQALHYNIAQAALWAGATRARLWLAQGNSDAAAQWVQGAGLTLTLDAPLHYMNEYEYISLVRILIARGKLTEAETLLARLLQLTDAEGRMRSVIEVLVLQALLYEAQGNTTQALQALSRALSLAEPEGFIRVFAEEGTAMTTLLMKLIHAKRTGHLSTTYPVSLNYVRKLLDVLGMCVVLPTEVRFQSIVQPLVSPLSERELTILHLIAAGMSNQQIADEMIVAVSTVKWHIKHIYDKLGVHSRTQMIARARELNVLL